MRTALKKRLSECSGNPVVFEFKVWVRPISEITKPEVEIEDATQDWPATGDEYKTVATLTIEPQDFDTPERREECEQLVFTPWHALEAHRPLGGINRLRRAVYDASVMFRKLPKFQ